MLTAPVFKDSLGFRKEEHGLFSKRRSGKIVPQICIVNWDGYPCLNDGMFTSVLLACVASVSVRFRRKGRPRNGILSFDRARNETRAKKWKWGEGEGKEGNACRQSPRFWKPAFASERSAWLTRLVEQCWHVTIKGLFHTEKTVWYATRILIFSGCFLFWALQCKNIFFDRFWNVTLFLRLSKGFRSFNLI